MTAQPLDYHIRAATAADAEVIAHAALLATHNPDDELPDPADVLHIAHHARYFERWPRDGDFGVIAEASQPLGAAWCRLFTVDQVEHQALTAGTPELAIAVMPGHQGRGIGTALLAAVLELAATGGHDAVELTVGKHRPWLINTYRQAGFATISVTETHLAMRAPTQPTRRLQSPTTGSAPGSVDS